MRGEVRSFKIGASRRIPVAALEKFVRRLSADARQDGAETTPGRAERRDER